MLDMPRGRLNGKRCKRATPARRVNTGKETPIANVLNKKKDLEIHQRGAKCPLGLPPKVASSGN